MKAYLKTNVKEFQSHLKFSSFFYFLILVTEVDHPSRVKRDFSTDGFIYSQRIKKNKPCGDNGSLVWCEGGVNQGLLPMTK
jgi:hypothetical protein